MVSGGGLAVILLAQRTPPCFACLSNLRAAALSAECLKFVCACAVLSGLRWPSAMTRIGKENRGTLFHGLRFPIPAPRSCFQAFFRALQLAYANIIQWNAMVSHPPGGERFNFCAAGTTPSDGGCARLRLPPFAMVQKLVCCPVACGLLCQQTRFAVLIL